MKCKYCGMEFDNKGKLLAHYKECPEKDKPKCCKVITDQPAKAMINAGDEYVLVRPEDYIPHECIASEIAQRDKRIRELEGKLADVKKVDTIVNGELYWPLSLLPDELSLLSDDQFVALKATGRIKNGKVLVQEVALGR